MPFVNFSLNYAVSVAFFCCLYHVYLISYLMGRKDVCVRVLIGFLNRYGQPTYTWSLPCLLGVPMFLCGLAIAVLGSRCHAPTVMLTNFLATPIELR